MPPVSPARRIARALLIGAAVLVGGPAACGSDGPLTLSTTPDGLIVDPFLWQGALDTISFLPLAVSDPATGRIESGWGPLGGGKPGEEFRVIVQLYPGQLSANSVAVQLFRRVGGVPAGVNPQSALQIQDAIILRARQIRSSIDE